FVEIDAGPCELLVHMNFTVEPYSPRLSRFKVAELTEEIEALFRRQDLCIQQGTGLFDEALDPHPQPVETPVELGLCHMQAVLHPELAAQRLPCLHRRIAKELLTSE